MKYKGVQGHIAIEFRILVTQESDDDEALRILTGLLRNTANLGVDTRKLHILEGVDLESATSMIDFRVETSAGYFEPVR